MRAGLQSSEYLCIPQVHTLNPNSHCDSIKWGTLEGWVCHEGSAITNGIIWDPRE